MSRGRAGEGGRLLVGHEAGARRAAQPRLQRRRRRAHVLGRRPAQHYTLPAVLAHVLNKHAATIFRDTFSHAKRKTFTPYIYMFFCNENNLSSRKVNKNETNKYDDSKPHVFA